ncbi:MAG: hypothetical protein K2O08_03520, partial [Clostridia bacterium]|nr:hypothetical protein [Clostridia bacterium]
MTDVNLSVDGGDGNEFFKVEKEFAGQRLDVFLGEKLRASRSHVKCLIDRQKVLVNNNVVKKAGYSLKENDELLVFEEEPRELNLSPQDIPIDIIY